MDKKVELQVLNITNSQAQVGAFAMLLGEVDGERQLPIIIGPAEAQATALYLKGIKTPRPLTHDLFTTSLTVLAVRADCPILIYESILDRECLRIPDEERNRSEETVGDKESMEEEHESSSRSATSKTLEQALEQAIKDENYELAAKIRDQINQRNKNQ